MARRGSSGDEPGRRGDEMTRGIKWLVLAIPVIAALLSIIGYLIGWFGGHSTPVSPPSGAAEYAAVCTLANAERGKWNAEVAKFRPEFEKASTPTKARDALLSLAESDIQNASALWSALDALTPVPAMGETQERLLAAWSGSLSTLRTYRDRLLAAASTAQVLALTQSLPRVQIEGNATLARALLMRLGGLGCHLDEAVVQPVADLSSAVARTLPHSHSNIVANVRQRATVPLAAAPNPEHRPTQPNIPPEVQLPSIERERVEGEGVSPAIHGAPLDTSPGGG